MPPPRVFESLGVFVRPGIITQAERRQILGAMADEPGEAAEVLNADSTLAHEASIRRVWDVPLPDDLHDTIAGRVNGLRPEMQTAFGVTLEACDAVAALRYPPGAFYRTHRDAAEHPDPGGLHRRAVSIVIFVNGGPEACFAGGRLRLYDLFDDPEVGLDMDPEPGTLVAFRSSLLHEVTPVEQGLRCTVVTWLLSGREERSRRP